MQKIETSIVRVEKVEIGFCPVVRINIRNQQEADEYMKQGVTIYEKTIQTPSGSRRYYFIEANVYDIAKIAFKK